MRGIRPRLRRRQRVAASEHGRATRRRISLVILGRGEMLLLSPRNAETDIKALLLVKFSNSLSLSLYVFSGNYVSVDGALRLPRKRLQNRDLTLSRSPTSSADNPRLSLRKRLGKFPYFFGFSAHTIRASQPRLRIEPREARCRRGTRDCMKRFREIAKMLVDMQKEFISYGASRVTFLKSSVTISLPAFCASSTF